MSATEAHGGDAGEVVGVKQVDLNLEVVVIPVSDVESAKDFYGSLGWRLDADIAPGDDFRLVQFTPPGSGCSIQFGESLTSAAPGSAEGLYLVASDIDAAHDELAGRGVQVTEIFHEGTRGSRFEQAANGRISGAAEAHSSYGSFVSFSDPDGNGWLVQEVTTRLPGRVDSAGTSFASPDDLAGALRRAAAAHGKHEERIGHEDPGWPDWYAEYIVAERSGRELLG